MKVFRFDPLTGKRCEQVADIAAPSATGAYIYDDSIKLPESTGTTQWAAIRRAEDRRGNLISFPFPVCFCTGEHFASMDRTDGTWWWFALIPSEA